MVVDERPDLSAWFSLSSIVYKISTSPGNITDKVHSKPLKSGAIELLDY